MTCVENIALYNSYMYEIHNTPAVFSSSSAHCVHEYNYPPYFVGSQMQKDTTISLLVMIIIIDDMRMSGP
jgi:hypothetical protein